MKKSQKIKLIVCFLVAVLGIFSFAIEGPINIAIDKMMSNLSIIIKQDNLVVHIINVGEGDAMAVNFPNGQVALIDTGLEETAGDVMEYIDTNVINDQKDKVIDYIFISHCDSDHTGGLTRIINNYDVKNVYRPRQYASFEDPIQCGYEATNQAYTSGISAIIEKDINLNVVVDEMTLDIGGVTLKFFSPYIQYEDSNDYSYFLKMMYKGKSFLFTGDASTTVEEDIMSEHSKELKSDYLKIAHHGSKYSTSAEFVACVQPKYAIISVGNNRYGHPTSIVLTNLQNVGAEVLRTDQNGNMAIKMIDEKLLTDTYYLTGIPLSWGLLCIVLEIVDLIVVIKFVPIAIENRRKTKKLTTKN